MRKWRQVKSTNLGIILVFVIGRLYMCVCGGGVQYVTVCTLPFGLMCKCPGAKRRQWAYGLWSRVRDAQTICLDLVVWRTAKAYLHTLAILVSNKCYRYFYRQHFFVFRYKANRFRHPPRTQHTKNERTKGENFENNRIHIECTYTPTLPDRIESICVIGPLSYASNRSITTASESYVI